MVGTAGNGFGVTKDGFFAFGYFKSSDLDKMTQVVRSFNMLIINGTVVNSKAALIAQRTAIGTDSKGNLMIFEVDGMEFEVGVTLQQLAEWMKEIGFVWQSILTAEEAVRLFTKVKFLILHIVMTTMKSAKDLCKPLRASNRSD